MALLHPEKVGVDTWYWSNTPSGGITNWGGNSNSPSLYSPTETLLNGINAIGFKWYYTAEPHPLPANSGGPEAPNPNPGSIIWYPAFREPGWQTAPYLAAVEANGRLIIGYNEPWNVWANLSPSQALDGYAALQSLPNRISAPSISNQTGFTTSWLADFMSGAASRGYRIDVINLHYYGLTASLTDFQAYIDLFHTTYGKPIIVSEWALANWGASPPANATWEEQAAFAHAGCQLMDGLDYVELHAWFGVTEGGGADLHSGCLNPDGSMTIVGQAFYDILHPGQTAPASLAELYKNGVLVGTATLPSGLIYPAVLLANAGDAGTANFGARPFSFLPVGATAWDSSAEPSSATIQTLGALSQTITATTGTGVAGVTLNPADKYADIVLSNANLKATYTTSRPPGSVNVRGTVAGSPDNYFEVIYNTIITGEVSAAGVGVANLSQSLSNYPGSPNAIGWFSNGYVEWPGSGFGNLWAGFSPGDVLGVFRRVTSVEFYKNGTLAGTAPTLPSGALYPVISPANNTDAATVNFGASAFSFAPSGALTWGTAGSTGPRTGQVTQILPGLVQTAVATGGTPTVSAWDPAAMGSGITLSNGNLTATITSGDISCVRTNVGYSAGKHYAELTLVSSPGSPVIGIEDSSFSLTNTPGSDGHGVGWYVNGWVGYNGNWAFLNTLAAGDILGIAYDVGLKRVWFAQNGIWFGNPVAGTGYIDVSSPGFTGPGYIMFGCANGDTATVNFGASGFAYTPPTGFSSP